MEILHNQVSVARKKTDIFLTKTSLQDWISSMETSMEETDLLLSEKERDFEKLGDSKLKTFGAFADIKIILQETKQKTF